MRGEGAACFRCSDVVWKREMARFTAEVVAQLEPLLLPNGGPVVLLQIENEYRYEHRRGTSTDAIFRNARTFPK